MEPSYIPTKTDISALTILPQPEHITPGEGSFLLTPDTVIVTDPQTHPTGQLLADFLAPALGFTLKVLSGEAGDAPALVLGINTELTQLGTEGYLLKVTPEQITIQAAAPAGVFYGTQ